ncbi:hypothetical protein HS088_TW01G01001 [Tripterygium wilfordii]|uniref:Uncharacterized protein n=1 Tax=Tripterygium wilfordii TaxID=458696 RepID=A0A7J7E341_TRIWF|nr:hypothetical protein HS088_TW01G01001 [Tripterygium wilfordii]
MSFRPKYGLWAQKYVKYLSGQTADSHSPLKKLSGSLSLSSLTKCVCDNTETMSLPTLLNLQTPKFYSLSASPLSPSFHLNPFSLRNLKFPLRTHSIASSLHSSFPISNDVLEDEDVVIGDCVVFEEGIFDDPYLQKDGDGGVVENFVTSNTRTRKSRKKIMEIEPENLIPDEWREAQAEINITKKERRKIAQELEFNSRVEKKRAALKPIRNVNLEEYKAFREAKLAQLKPIVLDNPAGFPVREEDEWDEEVEMKMNERVAPKNPRWAVYGKGFDDVVKFFNSENYVPGEKKSEGPRQKLFSKEEKVMLNQKIPDVAAATSGKWLPLHTLAASGEFYLVNELLKHNVDINAVDWDGLTALHKAIIGKKQAITNYLLRESANPFVLDKDGATLMHYAVQTASSAAIKVLLLYNVDINLPDNVYLIILSSFLFPNLCYDRQMFSFPNFFRMDGHHCILLFKREGQM